jgi:hypothetical protein
MTTNLPNKMSASSGISRPVRLLRIAGAYFGGIAVTFVAAALIVMVVHQMYFYPPAGIIDFFQKLGGLALAAVVFSPFLLLIGTAYTIIIGFTLALPAAFVIRYFETHRIRSYWPHCLGATLLWGGALLVLYLSANFLGPMPHDDSAGKIGGLLAAAMQVGGQLRDLDPSIQTLAWLAIVIVGPASCAAWVYWFVAGKHAGLDR